MYTILTRLLFENSDRKEFADCVISTDLDFHTSNALMNFKRIPMGYCCIIFMIDTLSKSSKLSKSIFSSVNIQILNEQKCNFDIKVFLTVK